jgi:hypothetical protein
MSEQTHKWLPDEPTNEMVNAAYHTWKHVAHPNIMSAIRAILKAAIQAAPEIKPVQTLEELEQEIYENTQTFIPHNVMQWMLKRYINHPPIVEQELVGKIVLHDCSYIGELFNSNDNHVEGTLLYTHPQPKD